jgi:hypothetical protein
MEFTRCLAKLALLGPPQSAPGSLHQIVCISHCLPKKGKGSSRPREKPRSDRQPDEFREFDDEAQTNNPKSEKTQCTDPRALSRPYYSGTYLRGKKNLQLGK